MQTSSTLGDLEIQLVMNRSDGWYRQCEEDGDGDGDVDGQLVVH